MVALLQSAPRCPNKVVFPFNAAWGMFQMFCFYFHWFSQVLEDGNGAGGANSPREGGSSDELWAQMQVLLIATLKIPCLVIFKTTGRQCNAGDCMKLYNANLKGQAALQQKPFWEFVPWHFPEIMWNGSVEEKFSFDFSSLPIQDLPGSSVIDQCSYINPKT